MGGADRDPSFWRVLESISIHYVFFIFCISLTLIGSASLYSRLLPLYHCQITPSVCPPRTPPLSLSLSALISLIFVLHTVIRCHSNLIFFILLFVSIYLSLSPLLCSPSLSVSEISLYLKIISLGSLSLCTHSLCLPELHPPPRGSNKSL